MGRRLVCTQALGVRFPGDPLMRDYGRSSQTARRLPAKQLEVGSTPTGASSYGRANGARALSSRQMVACVPYTGSVPVRTARRRPPQSPARSPRSPGGRPGPRPGRPGAGTRPPDRPNAGPWRPDHRRRRSPGRNPPLQADEFPTAQVNCRPNLHAPHAPARPRGQNGKTRNTTQNGAGCKVRTVLLERVPAVCCSPKCPLHPAFSQ